MIYNIAIFSSKSTKHGLKWKLTSSPICRVFDHFSMLNSLVGRGRRSTLVCLLAFGTTIFEISSFFYLHRQYVYQMKAKNIPDKNLTWKNIICYEKFEKNWFFYDFCLQFWWDFFFVVQIFFHPGVLQMINYTHGQGSNSPFMD